MRRFYFHNSDIEAGLPPGVLNVSMDREINRTGRSSAPGDFGIRLPVERALVKKITPQRRRC